ncbi:MAG: hypothetical protein Q8O89_09010 [Nanoarchaeota archaeon]|nr:hypothetical protein [Nanoarchaeota archaeon]
MKIFGKALAKPFLKRHASLELSVNAIVVLILAIAMLGLGLGFTKVMFAKLKGSIEIPEPENPATEDQPLVFNKELITAKADQALGFSVNVYNGDSEMAEDVIVTIEGCTDDVSDFEGVESSPQNIKARSSVTFKVYIPKDSNSNADVSGVCTIQAQGDVGSKNDVLLGTRQLSFEIAK